MTHNDYEHLHQIRNHWLKEQQLIRQKYQIPYNMTYIAKQCYSKPISISLPTESLLKNNQITATQNNTRKKPDRRERYPDIPPIYCLKCHLDLTKCLCQNGLGQWWNNLPKKARSTDNLSKKSLINSIHDRHVSFDRSLIDLSSIERTDSQTIKSKSNKHQYAFLDWNNRQSLLNFINQTTESNKNLSNMPIEQLQELITNDNHIHIFNSIIDLVLTLTKEQQHLSLCHIYIDPFYYLTIQDSMLLSQSQLIADNINLNHALYSIENLAILLGVKMNQSFDEYLHKRISKKQRKSILNQRLLFLASKSPNNTFRHTSLDK